MGEQMVQHNSSFMPMPVSCATTLSPLSFETMRTDPLASRTIADVLKLSIRCIKAATEDCCDDDDGNAEDNPMPT
jgi:hypothetical protein